MSAKQRMQAALKKSESNAKKLTRTGMKVRIKDAMTDMETVTRSMPWQLGHGEWVVSVEAKSGGWSCADLTVLESEVAA